MAANLQFQLKALIIAYVSLSNLRASKEVFSIGPMWSPHPTVAAESSRPPKNSFDTFGTFLPVRPDG